MELSIPKGTSLLRTNDPLGSINFPAARNAVIMACLEAMIEERRFTYTDILRVYV